MLVRQMAASSRPSSSRRSSCALVSSTISIESVGCLAIRRDSVLGEKGHSAHDRAHAQPAAVALQHADHLLAQVGEVGEDDPCVTQHALAQRVRHQAAVVAPVNSVPPSAASMSCSALVAPGWVMCTWPAALTSEPCSASATSRPQVLQVQARDDRRQRGRHAPHCRPGVQAAMPRRAAARHSRHTGLARVGAVAVVGQRTGDDAVVQGRLHPQRSQAGGQAEPPGHVAQRPGPRRAQSSSCMACAMRASLCSCCMPGALLLNSITPGRKNGIERAVVQLGVHAAQRVAEAVHAAQPLLEGTWRLASTRSSSAAAPRGRPGVEVARSIWPQPRRRPSSAMPSAGGLKAGAMKVSMQCAMASMPVAAVIIAGRPSVSSGSQIATLA